MMTRAILAFTALITFGHCRSIFPLPILPSLAIPSTSGVLFGIVNSSTPDVRSFLGIPFALPPTGKRRWLPPQKRLSIAPFIASNVGPSCPQFVTTKRAPLNTSVWASTGGGQTEAYPPEVDYSYFSEDCLTLNVWAPRKPKGLLPVLVFIPGGGFTQGGTNTLHYNPQAWVQRSQEHIVVTLNYRLNIFGFPNAEGLEEQNVGLLDKRMAIEWVRDNIAKFGGDPKRIVGWGQSAGSIDLEYLNFAYPKDPIFTGMIEDSGTALYEPQYTRQTADFDQKNFTAVARAFGCCCIDSSVECMREIPWQHIEDHLYEDSSLTFLPVADERTIFGNYTKQYASGAYSKIPAIIGSNQYEFNAYGVGTPELQAASDANTRNSFLCPAARVSQFRKGSSRTTYRYRYDGNFTNISPSAMYTGAYHGAELPLIFGTDYYHGADTPYEAEVSRKLQDLYLDFTKDPENGLKNSGWTSYGKGKIALLGGVKTPLELVDISDVDDVCFTT